ncbi:MAG: 23S rRNA (adenine(2503)-C(2))-methyltransferase RlmN [Deltaproteobacteria bacterium]|nr:MAG: 23S rRNA (adenine(2503)-C(2))-methyltransferase RlmN [Deltaproteobacteria bacterium]
MKQNILDLSKSSLESWLLEKGLKKFNLHQILQWLYRYRVKSFDEMTNLSKQTREVLKTHFEIRHLEPTEKHTSPVDGSTKFLFKLPDGKTVESVLMPIKGAKQKDGTESSNRITLCISSQVGCAMGCAFCRTAEMKLVRNLTQGEILGQVLGAQDFMKQDNTGADGRGPRVSNIVFMGMGEPLHNYDTVTDSLQLLTDVYGIGISQRKITVSTVGLAPEIRKFADNPPGARVKLALSLNATTEEGRKDVMPITKKYPLEEVIEACKEYTKKSKNRVTFEYVMMAGVNDSLDDAKRISKICAHLPSKINLIPYNEYPGSPFQRPSEESIQRFFHFLADRHHQVNIRYSKGLDVLAACGQLATSSKK